MSGKLDNYSNIDEIKEMSIKDLENFSVDIRKFLIDKVSKTGGHLASNLGVVELTLSLYKVFDFNNDRVIWDVGHQSYVHKILTGRKDKFDNLRNYGGLSGFPKRSESKYDCFETGHSSTSVSAGLGIARARDLSGKKYDVVSVIGDGALTGGMALEALNDLGYNKTKMIIILNDNQMSIAENVGGVSTYLSKLRTNPTYNKLKSDVNSTLSKIPAVGKEMVSSIQKLKDGFKQIIVPGMFFEEVGIRYFGPIDGHNIKDLTEVLSQAKQINEPVIIHVITKKGKGYKYAEQNPNKFHGVGPFNFSNGKTGSSSGVSYSKAFGDSMIELARENKNIVAITAAMPDGTGLNDFKKAYKNRFFDVGIAEQHAVTLAAGMASNGLKPVFAVYSTFLQRAFDQVLHDVSIQNLPVVFAIDRAGIVGQDGETHQGIFDLSYLSPIPNMTIMAPKCVDELKYMLKWATSQDFGPIAIRYPRGGDNQNVKFSPVREFKRGEWEIIYGSAKISIIATGKMVQHAVLAREELQLRNIDCEVINATFIKPVDEKMIRHMSKNSELIVTIEDNIIQGGLASLVNRSLVENSYKGKIINLGFNDEFVTHGSVDELYRLHKLDSNSIVERILKEYNK
ncbi:1-deoxy-D-xylulose-5-phosphate synthase [Hathewaya histolytica]|uniref:1-deoxy-D-xylulose-5-phosphate synthase n=1 Tax=Hathewaya histolytica TaxID=1498 RepID=UPI003B67A1B7